MFQVNLKKIKRDDEHFIFYGVAQLQFCNA